MKTPLLNEQERFILKLNREGKIYTPTRIAFYELAVACRKFKMPIKKLLKKHFQKLLWLNLILFLLLLVVLLTSCMPTLESRVPKSIVIGKRSNLWSGYWLKARTLEDYPSKRVFVGDTIWIQTSRSDYNYYISGDTIR